MIQVPLRALLESLPEDVWRNDTVLIHPIRDDYDLWYATVECQLKPGQEEFVNPAGFSIGRAYLQPECNYPCVICKPDGERIGYIVLRVLNFGECAFNWSYYLDRKFQGQGLGREAAKLAVQILSAAAPQTPIKLTTETANRGAQRLYESIGFVRLDDLDGDDLIYEWRGNQ